MIDSLQAQPISTYPELIKEVFIKPIRTVMVVDDQFPILDDFLTTGQVLDPAKEQNKGRVQEILKFCRDQNNSWLVDVHDGRQGDGDLAMARHLHHSDLMILDYHLDRFSNRGDKAIQILRELAKNSHFNLVIVYTAADAGIGGDINRTVAEIALGLTCYDDSLVWSGIGMDRLEEVLDQWNDLEPNAVGKLVEHIDQLTFVRLRWTKDRNLKKEVERQELEGFKTIVTSAAKQHNLQLEPHAVLKWVLQKVQQSRGNDLSPDDLGEVTLGISENSINWIRTNRLFVTVISKSRPPNELPSMLSAALETWDPLPHRLIISKMRAELDSAGAMAEDEILSNRYLQAGWLDDFLRGVDAMVPDGVAVERNWESLGDAIKPKVVNYSHRIARSLSGDINVRSRKFEGLTPLELANENALIRQHTNRHACSKRVDGNHLKIGHIIEIDRNEANLRYWICLTPACDLVPGQKNDSGWGQRLDGWLPFKAVQLFPETAENALRVAQRANHLFVEIDGSHKIFGFSPNPAALSNPRWEQMFAKNEGLFENEARHLTISTLSGDKANGIVASTIQARVVAQLRYEYALNLLQRLGTNLTRIGLDFRSYSTQQ